MHSQRERAVRNGKKRLERLADDQVRRAAFRLCLHLGCPHPDYLLELLTGEQFDEWLAFAAIEPFGDLRQDLRTAAQSATILGALAGSGRLPDIQFPYFEHGDALDMEATTIAMETYVDALQAELRQKR